ncbi:hypothetical protein GQS40_11610|uniref:Gluconate permease n=1 Tax=Leuconostoc lactis TaxID=1246 RepID=A0A6L7AEV1_LEULA|nr:hypothetical protein [Leuconostoc lactis]
MSFVVLALGILFLLLLIIKFKINTFIALILTASVVGLGLGMKLQQIPVSIQNGIGSSLGELARKISKVLNVSRGSSFL